MATRAECNRYRDSDRMAKIRALSDEQLCDMLRGETRIPAGHSLSDIMYEAAYRIERQPERGAQKNG